MPHRIRRVLTGHDSDGKSIIMTDGIAPNILEMSSMPGLALTDLWETKGAPASNDGHADAADRQVHLEPPRNGTILRIVEFPPDTQWRQSANAREAFDSIGAGHAPDRHSADPMMHKTATVDYIIVLKGEIWAIMDKGEVLLKAGDILVQRGTNHSWSVRTNEPCIIAAVLVSARPAGKRAKPAARKTAKGRARKSRKVRRKAKGRRR
jgi:mannose-6-phosphate isomerase-like protein (cupin superfamily)